MKTPIYTTINFAFCAQSVFVMKASGRRRGKSVPAGRYGFTLVEVLLVVVIITMMAAAGIGFYTGTYQKMLVKKAARDFLLAARYARVLAIEKQSPCRLQLDIINNRFLLVTNSPDKKGGEKKEKVVEDSYFKPTEFGNNIRFEKILITPANSGTNPDAEENEIIFLPNGTAQTAVIQIGDLRSCYTIGISEATGKANVYESPAEQVKIGSIDLDSRS